MHELVRGVEVCLVGDRFQLLGGGAEKVSPWSASRMLVWDAD
ncbi:hypothetical protein ACGF3J_38410 [Streptomyces sp. NPDC048171]